MVVAEKMELGAHRSYPFEQQPVAVMRRFVAVAAVEDAERWLVRNQNVSLVGDFANHGIVISAQNVAHQQRKAVEADAAERQHGVAKIVYVGGQTAYGVGPEHTIIVVAGNEHFIGIRQADEPLHEVVSLALGSGKGEVARMHQHIGLRQDWLTVQSVRV